MKTSRVLLGVCTTIAERMCAPVWFVRIVFSILFFFYGFGIALYLAIAVLLIGRDAWQKFVSSLLLGAGAIWSFGSVAESQLGWGSSPSGGPLFSPFGSPVGLAVLAVLIGISVFSGVEVRVGDLGARPESQDPEPEPSIEPVTDQDEDASRDPENPTADSYQPVAVGSFLNLSLEKARVIAARGYDSLSGKREERWILERLHSLDAFRRHLRARRASSRSVVAPITLTVLVLYAAVVAAVGFMGGKLPSGTVVVAIALAIVGVGLVVSSVRGRALSLIVVGVALASFLAFDSTISNPWIWDIKSASSDVEIGGTTRSLVGDYYLDFRDLPPPSATTTIDVRYGNVFIVVPQNANVTGQLRVDVGDARATSVEKLLEFEHHGHIHENYERRLTLARFSPGELSVIKLEGDGASIDLDIRVGSGNISITRMDPTPPDLISQGPPPPTEAPPPMQPSPPTQLPALPQRPVPPQTTDLGGGQQ